MPLDPWTALVTHGKDNISTMQSLGLHVMKKEWSDAGLGTGRVFSTSVHTTTLKIYGTTDELQIPVQTCTTVEDVKNMLADRLMISVQQLTFIIKQGHATRVHRDYEQIGRRVIVKGIQSFKVAPFQWPFPIGVLGTGFLGMRSAMKWIKDGANDLIVFDRHASFGGHFWLQAANKHSRLQAEFATYCLWFGPDMGGAAMTDVNTWDVFPDREGILRHFKNAADECGLAPHCRFSVSVDELKVVGRRTDDNRRYDVALTSTASLDVGIQDVRLSGLLSFPGAATVNRTVEFPGEDTFGGSISYGMGDETMYKELQGSVAVVGHGSFAVENARICLEQGVQKVHLVARRKNLILPRPVSWFVNQAAVAVPGALILKQASAMYDIAQLGDPFDFWGVHGSASSPTVLITQSAQFPISDVFFLALAYGRLAIVQGSIKRLTSRTLNLLDGEVLSKVDALIKAIGFTGDFRVDKLHQVKQMNGTWPDGDYRRPISVYPPGMHASNFENMSLGLPSYHMLQERKFFFDYPREYRRAADQGLLEMLPIRTAEGQQPAYCYDVRHFMMTSSTISAMCPRYLPLTLGINKYKHNWVQKVHPIKAFIDLCRKEWDEMQDEWQSSGDNHARIPYPYTELMIADFVAEHRAAVGNKSADDSALATLAPEDEQAYYEASRNWWQSNVGEAKVAWSGKKVAMTATRRGKSAG